jgi:hypothetical protein
MGSKLLYPSLWHCCVGAWAPSQDRSRSTILTDFSGYGNHGTLTSGDPGTDWIAAEGKTALRSEADLYVETNVVLSSGDLTVSLFAFYPSYREQCIISSQATDYSSTEIFLYAGAYYAGNYGGPGWQTTGTIPIGVWHNVTFVARGTTSEFYISGKLVSTGGENLKSTNNFHIFKRRAGGDYKSIADLDDIRLYNRALTQSEIALLATRRGIAYERASRRSYYVAGGAPPAENRRNNMLVGCGF